eukprot:g7243.t1
MSKPEVATAPTKVRIHLRPVGGAPIMKKNKFLVRGEDTFLAVQKFLHKMLRIKEGEPLFLFCNSAFAPAPDEEIRSLFECFQVNNELVINYQIAGAWG